MISSADIKRQILDSAKTNIRKQPKQLPEGVTEGDILEIGKNLEAVTKMAGWAAIEEFMFRRMNLVQMAMQDASSEVQRGIARGYIELMTYVEKTIENKNSIQARLKHETENVPKNQKKQGV